MPVATIKYGAEGRELQVHEVQPLLHASAKDSASYLRKRSLAIAKRSSKFEHVLLMKNNIAVASPSEGTPAKNILQQLCDSNAVPGLKGGGSESYAQGKAVEIISSQVVIECLSGKSPL